MKTVAHEKVNTRKKSTERSLVVVPSLEGDARALAAEPSVRGWTRCLANLFQLRHLVQS